MCDSVLPLQVPKYLKDCCILEANSVEDCMDKLLVLFKATKGITVTKIGMFSFRCCTYRFSCVINIFHNIGEYKKPVRRIGLFNSEFLPEKEGIIQFAVELHDTTRFFWRFFGYLSENFYVENFTPYVEMMDVKPKHRRISCTKRRRMRRNRDARKKRF